MASLDSVSLAILLGAVLVMAGILSSLLALITLRRMGAPIVQWFATQTLAWGFLELLVLVWRWRSLIMRDVSAATRLDRLTWLHAGVDVGIVGIGVTLAVTAWLHSRRLSVVGAGLGVIVQGLGLLVLNLTFAAALARLI